MWWGMGIFLSCYYIAFFLEFATAIIFDLKSLCKVEEEEEEEEEEGLCGCCLWLEEIEASLIGPSSLVPAPTPPLPLLEGRVGLVRGFGGEDLSTDLGDDLSTPKASFSLDLSLTFSLDFTLGST
jgi:hypothetical protein